jgi:23S rRNA (cytidine1920-2'-O)/16S rRNA (cytidine1409-2'-O)-methyltransferase
LQPSLRGRLLFYDFPHRRQTFQHHSGKLCAKHGHYSCNLLLTHWFSILHCIGCWHIGGATTKSNVTFSHLKTRLDKLLVERGITPSRERAQALILAGKVLVNEQKIEKAGASVESDCEIRLLGEDLRYVSRGGLKLEKALVHWQIDLSGKTCLDVGASTGGFSDCMLQHGAGRVIAVDTGYGQMEFRLHNDPHLRLLEKTNARYLTREQLGNAVDFVAMDVSFISATLVLPAVTQAAFSGSTRETRRMVVLVKPQFEVGRDLVGKGGIVRDEAAQQSAVLKVDTTLRNLGATRTDMTESPILGAEGNREFLLYAEFSPPVRD